LIGASAGEDKAIDVISRPTIGPPNSPASRDVQDRRARRRGAALPDLDEEFCKIVRRHRGRRRETARGSRRNMRRELDQTLRNRNKTAVMDKLLSPIPIDVPNALIESQIRDMQIEAMRRTGAKDASQAPPREPSWSRRGAAWRSG
jgi:hypothetical protein